MATQYAFGQIVTNGLVLALDAADQNSYTSGSTTWYDVSGNNNSGILTGSTLPQYVTSSNTLFFNGSTSYVNIPALNYTAGSSYTFNTWVLNNWTLTGQNIAPFPMILRDGNSGGSRLFIGIKIGSSANLGFNVYMSNAGSLETNNTTAPINNIWYNVVATYTAGTASLYLNAQLISQTSSSVIFAGTNNAGIMIANGSASGNSFWSGSISVVQAYNRALSATEVQQNYNAQKSRFGLT